MAAARGGEARGCGVSFLAARRLQHARALGHARLGDEPRKQRVAVESARLAHASLELEELGARYPRPSFDAERFRARLAAERVAERPAARVVVRVAAHQAQRRRS
jgi:hypothetical protein